MPAFPIPIGGIVKALTYCTIPGQTSVNTHKWQLTSLTSGSSFSSAGFTADYDTAMAALYAVLLATQATYYGTQVYLMNPIGLPPRPDSTSANVTSGTGGAGLLPTQTSGLISLRSSTLGKIGAGRSYIPFPYIDAAQTDGTPTTAYTDKLVDLGTFLRSNLLVIQGGVTGTFRPCLYRGGADTPRFIEEELSADAWATQRKRGSYGRSNKTPF